MFNIIAYVILGLVAGTLAGILGIGGGIIIVPALVYLFGLSQHQAQGTTLALLVPPIGLLAALVYYNKGYVNLKIAAFTCLGFFIGGLLGADIAAHISDPFLKKIFGIALLGISIRMILGK
ncbi:MAG: sulfite exporter TauE/SafE family protein [bacterium]|nr:sulfite exporter TauE/SafE family protein [bacterium]